MFNAAGGDWNVVFFYVGTGQGDYRLDSLTETGQRVFVLVGAGLGSYRVGRPLAMPASHSLATFSVQLGDSLLSGLDAEWDVSQVDRNLLSGRDENDNHGGAGRLAGRLEAGSVSLGGRRLGRLSLRGAWEGRDARFVPMPAAAIDRTTTKAGVWENGRAARDSWTRPTGSPRPRRSGGPKAGAVSWT